MDIPLFREFDTFRSLRAHEVIARILSKAKNHALTKYNRRLPVEFNLDRIGVDAVPFLDLVDYVDVEFSYSTNGSRDEPEYFPGARTTAIVKILNALGFPAKVAASFLGTKSEIAERGLENTPEAAKTSRQKRQKVEPYESLRSPQGEWKRCGDYHPASRSGLRS